MSKWKPVGEKRDDGHDGYFVKEENNHGRRRTVHYRMASTGRLVASVLYAETMLDFRNRKTLETELNREKDKLLAEKKKLTFELQHLDLKMNEVQSKLKCISHLLKEEEK